MTLETEDEDVKIKWMRKNEIIIALSRDCGFSLSKISSILNNRAKENYPHVHFDDSIIEATIKEELPPLRSNSRVLTFNKDAYELVLEIGKQYLPSSTLRKIDNWLQFKKGSNSVLFAELGDDVSLTSHFLRYCKPEIAKILLDDSNALEEALENTVRKIVNKKIADIVSTLNSYQIL